MGLIIWLIAVYRRELTLYQPSLLNTLFALHAITALASTALIEANPLGAAKSLISTYIQWYWFSSVISRHCEGSQTRHCEPEGRSNPQARDRHAAAPLAMTNDYNKPALVLACAGTIFGTIVLLQALALIPSPALNIYGLQKQPFTSSALLLFTAFTTLYCLEEAKREHWLDLRRSYFIAFSIQLVALFLLGQRSTVIGTIVGLLIYLAASQTLNLKHKLASLSVLALGLGSAITLAERFRRKFVKLLEPSSLLGTNSMQCRLDLWQQNITAWLNAKNSALYFGLGEVMPLICKETQLNHMHNIFLQQLIRKGLLGLASWLAFYLWSFVELIKRRSSIAFIAAFIAISIEGLFENWWGDTEVLSGFLFMLCLANNVSANGLLRR